ncbi:putative Late nodulin [Medicago truncatula]|uniref:Nodule Cysteine-Rich (NCR) secreted peptide n=1 Tax=Medicago truncatula TaxID=3880 RepID=I3SGY2_MEDTR|nr:unknown [Medicago truncatula]KEH28289.1 Nodule Cysteine-Rich (NCR) secreted peptide [Medicago truncatula]RHN57180.1 putative Late nodulin [Medicago truncatula]
MAETLKFVYVMILFLSIFLVITISNSNPYIINILCKTDKDCPKVQGANIRCRSGKCVQV